MDKFENRAGAVADELDELYQEAEEQYDIIARAEERLAGIAQRIDEIVQKI